MGGRKAHHREGAAGGGQGIFEDGAAELLRHAEDDGSMTMRPASKKIGKPNSREAMPSAKGRGGSRSG